MISRIKDRHRYRSIFFSRKKYKTFKTRPYIIRLPEQLDIKTLTSRNALLNLVKKMIDAAGRGKNIKVDFSRTRKAYSHGMLYLFAEISNLVNIYPDIKFFCKKSLTQKMNHVLNQIGLFRLCHKTFSPKQDYEDVVHWRVTRGTKIIQNEFDDIVDPVKELPILKNMNIDIYGACIEATKNAFCHAYIEERNLSRVKKEKTGWWMFSQIRDNTISVAICDLGIGIPGTLPKTNRPFYIKIKSMIEGIADADLIKAAIEKPSSRTNMGFRGNGLKKIAEIARTDPSAALVIHSGHGYIEIIKGKIRKYNYRNPFPGTLVAWLLPLEQKNDDN